LLSEKIVKTAKSTGLVFGLLMAASLSACQFQPLYAPSADVDGNASPLQAQLLAEVDVGEVNTRVGQQVRNHLLFLFNGGNQPLEPQFDTRLQVSSFERRTSAHISLSDTTAGFVTVTASYVLIDKSNQKRIASGSRKASAYFDRTSQIFANQRAVRDAENRAGREVAEKLRFAIASDLRR
jgi:LPS-assembly lipoprotein